MKIISFGHDPDAQLLPSKKRDLISFGFGSDHAVLPPHPGKQIQWPVVFIREHEAAHVVGLQTPSESQVQLEEAAKNAYASLDAKQKGVEDEFEKPMTAARLYEITDGAWKTASQQWNIAKDLSGDYKRLKDETWKAVDRLLELRAMADALRKDPSGTTPFLIQVRNALSPGSQLSNEYKHFVTFPFWGSKIGIQAAVTQRANLVAIVNLPSGVITYVADQAGKGIAGLAKGAGEGLKAIPPALGLPGWLLPVAVGAALLGVAGIVVSKVKDASSIIPTPHPEHA